jgi:hypothetical protein
MVMSDDRKWFAAKTLGYGAGLPVAWQGWVVLAALIAGPIVLVPLCMPAHPGYFALGCVVYTTAWFPLMARKTRGGWKWRNGRE